MAPGAVVAELARHGYYHTRPRWHRSHVRVGYYHAVREEGIRQVPEVAVQASCHAVSHRGVARTVR